MKNKKKNLIKLFHIMYLSRYTQPKRTFSLCIPTRPSLILLKNRVQFSAPKLVIPSINNNNLNKNMGISQNMNDSSSNLLEKNKKQDNNVVVDNELSKFISISANGHVLKEEIDVPSLDQLPSPKMSNFDRIFTEKIKVCNLIFNFDQPQAQLKGKAAKTEALNEINSLLSKRSEAKLITEKQKKLIYDMLMRNIFDQDPFFATESIYLSTIKWDFIEPSWPHLNLVYQILNQFILSFPENLQTNFVRTAIKLLNIPDKNEAEMILSFLKNYLLIHPDQLDKVWVMIKNALINVISNIYTPYCVDPIISFISSTFRSNQILSIIDTHLLPLYRHELLYLYSKKLTDLIIQVLEKKVLEQVDAIEFLIHHFPHQCGQKQFLFISSISSICGIAKGSDLIHIGNKLILFLGLVIKLPNLKLVESALKLILTPAITSIIFKKAKLAMDSLYETLNWSSSNHWDSNIKVLSKKVLTTLTKINAEVQKKGSISNSTNSSRYPFAINNEVCQQIPNDAMETDNKELVAKWALIARCASKKNDSIDLTDSLLHIQSNLLNENKSSHEQYYFLAKPGDIPMNQMRRIGSFKLTN